MNSLHAMEFALDLANRAALLDEVPVGAVIIYNDEVIATGHNLRHTSKRVIQHAEIVAIDAACRKLGSWRLSDCHLIVTLEPCLMCAGAISQARIKRVTFGASDPKGGALGSLYCVHEDTRLNHTFDVEAGLMQERCSELLKVFFRKKREKKD